MVDEVLEELWRVKDEIAREHDYDVRRLAEFLKKSEKNWRASDTKACDQVPPDTAGAASGE